MAFDLDNEELKATRKDKGLDDELYEETSNKDVASDSVITHKFAIMQQQIDEKDKRIQELEEERQIVGMPVKNKKSGKIGIVLHQWKSGSIAVLENINPRVINTHESWNTLEIITDEVKQVQTNSNSIPKQKIKETLEDIEYYFERLNGPDEDIEYIRQLKQELLEGEK